MQVEQRTLPLVMRQSWHHVRGELPGEMAHRLMRFIRIDVNPPGILMRKITQHAQAEIEILVEQRQRCGLARLRLDVVPEFAQVFDVGGEFTVGRGFSHGADDESAFFIGRHQLLQFLAQVHALFFVFDTLGNADMRFLRQINQQPAGDADLGG